MASGQGFTTDGLGDQFNGCSLGLSFLTEVEPHAKSSSGKTASTISCKSGCSGIWEAVLVTPSLPAKGCEDKSFPKYLISIPTGIALEFPCPLAVVAGCTRIFDDPQKYYKHSLKHFLDGHLLARPGPPAEFPCVIEDCSVYFRNHKDPYAAWAAFIEHFLGSHFAKGQTLPQNARYLKSEAFISGLKQGEPVWPYPEDRDAFGEVSASNDYARRQIRAQQVQSRVRRD